VIERREGKANEMEDRCFKVNRHPISHNLDHTEITQKLPRLYRLCHMIMGLHNAIRRDAVIEVALSMRDLRVRDRVETSPGPTKTS